MKGALVFWPERSGEPARHEVYPSLRKARKEAGSGHVVSTLEDVRRLAPLHQTQLRNSVHRDVGLPEADARSSEAERTWEKVVHAVYLQTSEHEDDRRPAGRIARSPGGVPPVGTPPARPVTRRPPDRRVDPRTDPPPDVLKHGSMAEKVAVYAHRYRPLEDFCVMMNAVKQGNTPWTPGNVWSSLKTVLADRKGWGVEVKEGHVRVWR